jgi:hypothetical protein
MAEEGASPDVTQDNLQQTQGNPEWWDTHIPEDFKSEKTLEKFKTEDGIQNLAKSYMELEKWKGSAIRLPGDNATEQDVQDFRRKLGIPETPDKYEFKYKEHELVKFNEEQDKTWKALAHKIGLTPKQAQELADFDFDRTVGRINDQTRQYKEAEDALRQEFGNGFENVLDRANNVLRTFASEKDMELIKPFENDVRLVRLLANIGNQMGEHSFKTGEAKTQQDTKETLLKQMQEQQLIYMDTAKDMPLRKAANKEYQRLAELVYGTAEVSSSADAKL